MNGHTRIRHLAFETVGSSTARPVFILHGTPGSRKVPRPKRYVLDMMGIRLITFDRPGYGESPRQENRRVVDAAADVAEVADTLGLETFAVLGRSGGGPHALAAAARLPKRVTRAASLVGLAPHAADGLDWLNGMCKSNERHYRRATSGEADSQALHSDLATNTSLLATQGAGYLSVNHDNEMPDADRKVLADAGIRGLLSHNFSGAVANDDNRVSATASESQPDHPRRVLAGWWDDTHALITDWGFRLEDITVPVLLWHGAEDVFSPVDHTRWLADRIPDATVVIEPRSAHFGALTVLPDVLKWLVQT